MCISGVQDGLDLKLGGLDFVVQVESGVSPAAKNNTSDKLTKVNLYTASASLENPKFEFEFYYFSESWTSSFQV